MYAIDIQNRQTGEEAMIFGYSVRDAFDRTPSYNPNEWTVTCVSYED